MGMKLSPQSRVADAVTGRRHGRVKKVLRETRDVVVMVGPNTPVKVGEQVISERFVVEWVDGATSEHEFEELCVRYTSQSKGWKPEKYGRQEVAA